MPPNVVTESGSYTVAANAITTTTNPGLPSLPKPYCVAGTAMHLLTVETSANMGPMGQVTIDEDVVAQKQP
jgi:hypothetical protein